MIKFAVHRTLALLSLHTAITAGAVPLAVDVRNASFEEQKTTLTFPEIKEVYGRDDYNLRFMLAQALMLAGKNYFPKNKYNPNPKKEGDLLFTHYIGEKDQNLMMQKVGKDALVVLKPLVAMVEKDMSKPGLAETKFFKDSSPALPEVKKVKVLLDKLPVGQFPM